MTAVILLQKLAQSSSDGQAYGRMLGGEINTAFCCQPDGGRWLHWGLVKDTKFQVEPGHCHKTQNTLSYMVVCTAVGDGL